MKLTTLAAAVAIVGGLGLGAGLGSGVAIAQPALPLPLKPGNGHGHDGCPSRCVGPDVNRGDWNANKWKIDPHRPWDDSWGAPPWGWGPPPPVYWNGGPPPQSLDYWGYPANPVWDDGFHQWGIWLFGQWIPIFGIGFS